MIMKCVNVKDSVIESATGNRSVNHILNFDPDCMHHLPTEFNNISKLINCPLQFFKTMVAMETADAHKWCILVIYFKMPTTLVF